MARLPRIWVPNLAEHVVVRGNNKQAIFRSEGDRIFFHRCLAIEARRFEISVHAYVLMDNHVHLLLTAASPGNLSRLLQTVGRRYVPYFNYLHRRTGTLWEGRYRTCPVDSERYLITCQRYIELNPVRAGMVEGAGAFAWSSHRHYMGRVADDLVSAHPVYLSLAENEAARRSFYGKYFECEMASETIKAIRDALRTGRPLGDPEFVARLEARTGMRLTELPRGRRPWKVELTQFQSDPNYLAAE